MDMDGYTFLAGMGALKHTTSELEACNCLSKRIIQTLETCAHGKSPPPDTPTDLQPHPLTDKVRNRYPV